VYLVEAAATTMEVVVRRMAANSQLPWLRKVGQGKVVKQGRGFSWAQVRGKK